MKELAGIFKKTFDSYYEAPLHIWESFVELGQIMNTSKNEVIKKSNERARYFYFIIKGSGGIMLYINNNYKCIDLCFEGDFFGDYLSFITNTTTELEVVCFEPCILFSIEKEKFDVLSQTPHGRMICYFAAESLFIHKQQQQIELLTKTAEQRYLDILSQQPNIIQRVSNKHIASYLGITPESFSRIRKKIT